MRAARLLRLPATKGAAMGFTPHEELQLFILVAAFAGMVVVAARARLPLPVLLVTGGLLLGLVPGLPRLTLPPDIVLVAILPPLLYSSAFFPGIRALLADLRPISLLAIGLVAVTTTGIAVIAHEILSLGWPSAFPLGAIVSPTGALAAREP